MLLTRTINSFYNALLSLVYPQACSLCGGSVEDRCLGVACAQCWRETRTFTATDIICWKCGALSLGTIVPEKRDQVRCRRCDGDAFTTARACGAYEGALRASVLALKREPHISQRLVTLLVETQERAPLDKATRVIPVPLHPDREKARGFNQAAVIGSQLARAVRLPFDEVSLIRTVHSERHRAGMDAKGRRETVAEAFSVRYPRLIEDEHVLVVDDVFTTGATVSACAAALMASGAKEVLVLTIARTMNQ
ncbi:MAG TPA: ComF family protein [Pyrinomonadaceae bacterium]|nr:ComF family protein [Pyrinomonadaceae bacterium]